MPGAGLSSSGTTIFDGNGDDGAYHDHSTEKITLPRLHELNRVEWFERSSGF
jgi:hypothetical protein